jgi:aerobic carbon-monoxide dehydrogenase small subunit
MDSAGQLHEMAGPSPSAPARTVRVRLRTNGVESTHDVEARLLLVQHLRENLGLTGTHVGCDTSNCGACTVLLDGAPVKSCTVLAAQADGATVTTVEGLAGPGGELTPVQEGFRQEHGLQCGYCTPGMLMAATALLAETPDPPPARIREALEGNLCRCTGYEMIVRSVRWAAEHPEGTSADRGAPA